MKMRKVLVVGGGGREHALAMRLLESPSVAEVLVAPGNAGTAGRWNGKPLCAAAGEPVEVARREAVDLVVIGPEAALCGGLSDRLAAEGIPAFGVSAAVARLEGSKSFMKHFAMRYGIPTARFHVVRSLAEAETALRDFPEPPVVKADGLCAGKGVVVAETHEEALAALRPMLSGERFGDAGRTVVLEERLRGTEVSAHALADGERALLLPPAADHKRIHDGETGPNTGGMGTYAPAPWHAPEHAAKAERLISRVVEGMRAEGLPYRGALFAGLMIPDGNAAEPMLLEINVRFGDPETQVLMPLVDGDLAELLLEAATGRLGAELPLRDVHAVCVVMAAAGYPDAPRLGDAISGLDAAAALPGVCVVHAGTRRDATGAVVTSGGRVLGVTGLGATLPEAHRRAYDAVAEIAFSGSQVRRDIAAAGLARARATQ